MDQIALYFQLKDKRNANAIIAAEALIAWVELLERAGQVIDPNGTLTVELVGTEPGSLKLPVVLKFVEDQAAIIAAGASEYPHLKKMALASAAVIATATTTVAIEQIVTPNVQQVELSEKDRAILKELKSEIAKSKDVKHAQQRLYRTLDKDPAISGVGVSDNTETEPAIIIPKNQFAERAGLWSQSIDQKQEQTVEHVWNVVLVKAAFSSIPRGWRFSRDGIEFGAKMNDAYFLEALSAGRIPISLQEGVLMTIEVEYKEVLEGQLWVYVPNTRKVTRVITPEPTSF
jgi:hypothetical protein